MSEMQWQPIETAPKDGRFVLIASRSIVGGVVMVWWASDVPYPCFMDFDGDSYEDATHWMNLPLPPPPETAVKERG